MNTHALIEYALGERTAHIEFIEQQKQGWQAILSDIARQLESTNHSL